jgi:hypothetical protein
MFPVDFANRVIQEYTDPGDWILDPFARRGTAIFSAATQGRFGLGIEINPVGWVYGRAKLHTGAREDVEKLIRWLGSMVPRYREQAAALPDFFKHCFCPAVREFLVTARSLLHWRCRRADWTTIALLLIDLHGKRKDSLESDAADEGDVASVCDPLVVRTRFIAPGARSCRVHVQEGGMALCEGTTGD